METVLFCLQGHPRESHAAKDGPLLREHHRYRVGSKASFVSSKFELAKDKNLRTYFIDEISSLNRPSSWDVLAFDLDLFWKNVVSDFFSWFADIWPLEKSIKKWWIVTFPNMHSYAITPTAK